MPWGTGPNVYFDEYNYHNSMESRLIEENNHKSNADEFLFDRDAVQ